MKSQIFSKRKRKGTQRSSKRRDSSQACCVRIRTRIEGKTERVPAKTRKTERAGMAILQRISQISAGVTRKSAPV